MDSNISEKLSSGLMTEADMQLFLEEHLDILNEAWEEAAENGWTDIVFIWQVEGDDLHYVVSPRDMAIAALDQECTGLPPDTRESLNTPANKDHAWLLFVTPTWFASMQVARVRFDLN